MPKLKLDDCYEDGKWFAIERAEHDGRKWLEPLGGNGFALQCSSRISDADVEGDADDMRSIARGIEARTSGGGDRCAVKVAGERVELWSPRNSQRRGVVSLEDADDIARQIREQLGGDDAETRS